MSASATILRVVRHSALPLAFAFSIAIVSAAAADYGYIEDDPAFARLNWSTGSHTLAESRGVVDVPRAAGGLFDPGDRNAISYACTCTPGADEAYLRFNRLGSVEFRHTQDTFVDDRDWGSVDPVFLLQSMRTRARELVGTHYTTIYGTTNIFGWGARPAYDRVHHAVTFMVHVVGDDGHDDYDARALMLGRYGVETLFARSHSPTAASTLLTLRRGVAAFHFAPGYRYEDHRSTDPSGSMPISMMLMIDSGARFTRVANPALVPAYRINFLNVTLAAVLCIGALSAIFAVVRRQSRRRAIP